MTDIVERLRDKWKHSEDDCYEAADEIERLRAMVDQCDHHEYQLQAINAEVDKLRADSEKYLKLAASYKSDLERLRGSEVCWGGEDD